MPVRHRPLILQNNKNGLWNYSCAGCNDQKSDLKSKATAEIAFKAHIAASKHKTR